MSASLSPIERAIKFADTQEKLAKAIGVKYQSQVSGWVTGFRPIPAKYCLRIEAFTCGSVTAAELRPDIFGEPSLAA